MFKHRFYYLKYTLVLLMSVAFVGFLGTFAWVVLFPQIEARMAGTAQSVTSTDSAVDLDQGSNLATTVPRGRALLPTPASTESQLGAEQQQELNSGVKITVTPNTRITREIKSSICGHVEVGIPLRDPALVGLSLEELSLLYPPEEGWEISLGVADRVILRLTLPQLCTQDAEKRHLGVIDGRIAIFYGPAGYSAGLEKLTNLPLGDLPLEWRGVIEQGMMEFDNPEALAQALDNLDEYR